MRKQDEKTQLTIEELEKKNAQLEQRNKELEAKMEYYKQQFALIQAKRFGTSSEKTNKDQLELQLFNEAEVSSAVLLAEPTLETISYTRKKKIGRADRLNDLPVETIHYDLSESEKVCSECDHSMHEMSTQVRKELKITPAQVTVVEHVQHIYSCRHCETHEIKTPIKKAEMSRPVVPKGLASPSAVAFVMTQKFADGLPLYRQEKQLERMGLPLSRQTILNWMLSSSTSWLKPFYAKLYRRIRQEEVLHADETTLQMLEEPGKKAESKSYMWLYRTGRDSDTPIVLFDYQASRAKENPQKFLEGFKGYLHVVGYAGYGSIHNVDLAGCSAHARRKFDEALKALRGAPAGAGRTTVAKKGLDFCHRLFTIERKIKDKTPEERLKIRKSDSQPVLDAFLT